MHLCWERRTMGRCTCVYLGQCVTMEVVSLYVSHISGLYIQYHDQCVTIGLSLYVSHISGLTQVLACAPSNIAVDNLVERLSAARAKVGGGSECMCE